MMYLSSVAKAAGIRMMPFGQAVILYFKLVKKTGDLWSTLMKCAPIVCLMIFVVLTNEGVSKLKKRRYSSRIFLGLLFSCIGDALLNLDLFIGGMAAFGLAQFFYILAFGPKTTKHAIGLPIYTLSSTFIVAFYVNAKEVDTGILIGLPIYSFFVGTMCWRALARIDAKLDFITVLCGIGSVSFVISDAMIAVDMFLNRIPNARFYIMSTYYFAQFAITLSILGDEQMPKPKKPKKIKEVAVLFEKQCSWRTKEEIDYDEANKYE